MIVDRDDMPFKGLVSGARQEVLGVQGHAESPWRAVLETENTIGAIAGLAETFIDMPNRFNDTSERVIDFRTAIQGYEPYASSFSDAETVEDFSRIRRKIDRERRAQQVIAEAEGEGTLALLTLGVVDPVNLIPGGAVVRSARTGQRVISGAKTAAIAGFGAGLTSETLLQLDQETRTLTESGINVFASTVLSGILGGAVGLIKDQKTIVDKFVNDMTRTEDIVLTPKGPESAGAAAAPRTTIEQETLKSAGGLEKTFSFQDPLLRAANSNSLQARKAMQQLAEYPLKFAKNAEGIASPVSVEAKIRSHQAGLYRGIIETDDLFVRHRFGRERKAFDVAKIGVSDMISSNSGKLTRKQFYEEVGKAMRRGDDHAIPEVADAAKAMRREVFDPLKQQAIKAGILPEDVDVTTAQTYLTRIYNQEKIAAQRTEFEDVLVRWLADNNAEELTVEELAFIASDITDTLLGSAPNRVLIDAVPLERGPLKERTLNIADELIEPWLENDVELVARAYTRTVGADVELTQMFGRADLEDQITAIRDDYQQLRKGKSEKELTALNKQMQGDIRDLQAVRDRLRGTFAIPSTGPGLAAARVSSFVKTLNYVRLLGGMTASAIPDIARPIMVHGIDRTMKAPMDAIMKGTKGFKIAAEEVKLAGTALDMVLDSRAMAIADIVDDFGRNTKLERGLRGVGQKFGTVSLMAPWNAAIKQFVGVVSQTRTLNAVKAFKKGVIDSKEIERLAALGIDEDMANRIARQFDKHGENVKGTKWANTTAWDDFDAREIYRAALAKEVDKTIITPGQDKPLWMSTPLGSMIGQFRSFSVSSSQRAMLSGLQDRDAAAFSGAMAMIGLGMLSYAIKAKAAGFELSDDPAVWVTEGIDRSGLTGWFFDVNNTVEKLTRGGIGVSRLTGAPTMSRYQSRNAVGALLGPTFGTVSDIAQVTGAAGAGEWTASDTRAVRRLLPYQNLIYMRRLFDEVEAGINETIGVN